MNHGDKPNLKHQEKQKMLDELESLSRLLDEELDDELDEPSRPIPEDIPVLKSFVDDVPVLNERFIEELTPVPAPVPVQRTDSVDKNAGQFRTLPNTRNSGQLDVSFLDKDPLEISAAVRQHKQVPDLEIPTLDAVEDRVPPPRTAPAPAVKAAPVETPRHASLETAKSASTETPKSAANTPRPASPIPPSVSASFMPGATSKPAPAPVAPAPVEPPPAKPMTAASVTQPLSRFQTAGKSENPFLPKSTLDKIRENHANDASSELRKLIENNPLQKLSFDMAPNSREYQQLRQKASQMVNEVIRANMPRLEAELRLKLEQDVDRMFKELKKK
jgi:hypothetical protein